MAKGNRVFRQVVHSANNRTPTAKERKEDARRDAATKATVKRLEADSRALQHEVNRREREEKAHQKAEEDRRKAKG